MFKVINTVSGVADIVSTNGDITELPTDYEVGSSCSYTDPTNQELHIYKLTSQDGTFNNKVWVEI